MERAGSWHATTSIATGGGFQQPYRLAFHWGIMNGTSLGSVHTPSKPQITLCATGSASAEKIQRKKAIHTGEASGTQP
ncbi:MAG: hypothetical protein SGJ20_07610 [Planctomycetota bacterium]|nr:hypothetical protein [Planctomycetota bacterium]